MQSKMRGSASTDRTVSLKRGARPTSRFTRWLAPPVLIVSLITAFGACGNGKPSGIRETESIPECDAYASVYGACMAQLGVTASGPAERHLANVRQEVAASLPNEAERDRLRSSCVFGTRQLELACR